MMRTLAVIGLLSLYMLAMLKPVMPYIDYALNYEFIKEELCENKAKPQMKCHGKCYLQKEIAKTKDAEENPAMPNFKEVPEDYYTNVSSTYSIFSITEDQQNLTPSIAEEPLTGFSKDLLDPPRV
jgi:hypothetical protein